MKEIQSRKQNKIQPQSQQKLYSKISRTYNYKYHCFTFCKVANIRNYCVIHILMFSGFAIYAVVCAPSINVIIVVLSAIFYLLTAIFLIFLAFIDPGIIPKFLQNYENPDYIGIPTDPRYFNEQKRQERWSYSIVQKNFLPTMRFCQQCCIYKPPRTVHCYTCNACMKKLDHHCPWIGTCIAKNNYKYFILFVSCLSIFLSLILGQTIYGVVKFSKDLNIALIIFNSLLVLLSFLGLAFSGTLLFYHIYLIKNQLTTNQFCKQTWVIAGNPYNKSSCIKNFLKMFNSPKILLANPEKLFVQRPIRSIKSLEQPREIQEPSADPIQDHQITIKMHFQFEESQSKKKQSIKQTQENFKTQYLTPKKATKQLNQNQSTDYKKKNSNEREN